MIQEVAQAFMADLAGPQMLVPVQTRTELDA